MSRPTNNMSEELFKVDGKTSVGETLPLALQHVVAMIVGCVTPAIIVAGVAGNHGYQFCLCTDYAGNCRKI